MRMTRAEIYLKNFEHNIAQIKRLLKHGTKICASVKANAYGHGAVQCAKRAVASGAEYLSVATVGEGAELRKNGITAPILLLSLCSPNEMQSVVRHRLTPLVGDEEYIGLLERAAKNASGKSRSKGKFQVHLAIDTGMGRIGCLPEEAAFLAKKIAASEFISLGGICTHFASADEATKSGKEYSNLQWQKFMSAVKAVRSAKIDTGLLHASASAAILEQRRWHLDMVRPGIILYGSYPGDITKKHLLAAGKDIDLKPVMALVTGVSAIRRFEKGMSVSYGRTWKCPKKTDIAVLPIGYADGLLRRSSPGLKVAIGDKLYPVRGRICMDQCMAELGLESDVKRFSRVVIFGPKESGALFTADTLAKAQGTISYEIYCGISSRVKRVFID